jgi:hypothetical protein
MRAGTACLVLVAAVAVFACNAVFNFDDKVPTTADVGAPVDQPDGSADPDPEGQPPDAGLVVDRMDTADRAAADLPLPADRAADLPSPADRAADLPSPADRAADLPSPADRAADLPLSPDRGPDLAPPPPDDDD